MPYVDLQAELFHPRWQLQRLTWRHGCGDAHACGARLHRFEPCPPGCATHKGYKRGCPKPCTKTCVRHASICPDRKGGGLAFTSPRTKKSTNPVPIPPAFIPYLIAHKAQQDELRKAAGELWQEHQAVFTRADGRPIDPRDDWEEFKERSYWRRRASRTAASTTEAATRRERSCTSWGWTCPRSWRSFGTPRSARRAATSRAARISRRTRCAGRETPSCPPRNRRPGPRLRLELRPGTAARPVHGAAAVSSKSKSPRSRRVSPEASTEPPSGFEPETYALRVRCSGQLS